MTCDSRPFLLIILAATACSGAPTPRQAAKQRESASSTAASALMLAGAWRDGTAPGVYATHTMQQFSSQLARAESSKVWSALSPPAHTALTDELSRLRALTAMMDTAMRQGDASQLPSLHDSLASHRHALSAIPIDTTS